MEHTMHDYQAESDANTLKSAMEIMADTTRHAKAKAHARNMAKMMEKVAVEGPNDDAENSLRKGYRSVK